MGQSACEGPLAAQAGSWAVAADLAERWGGFQVVPRPGPGDSNVALLVAPDREPDSGVLLDPIAGITLAAGGEVLERPGVWRLLATGEGAVMEVSARIAERLGCRAGAGPAPHGVRFMAELARQLALFQIQWRIVGTLNEGAAGISEGGIGTLGPEVFDARPGEVWFIVAEPVQRDDQQRLVAAVDMRHEHLHLPGSPRRALWEAASSPGGQVSALLGRHVSESVRANPPQRPGLGLPAVLSQFNRKERFYLLSFAAGESGAELHGESLSLTPRFRRTLQQFLQLDGIPPHAWASVDYHLDWLHAALQWAAGVSHVAQSDSFAARWAEEGVAQEPTQLVAGSQEDIDLVLCWTDSSGRAQLVLVEAKGYSPWSNSQAKHKIRRLEAIIDAAHSAGLNVDVRLALCSPDKPSQKLDTSGWPQWALTPHGRPWWVPLPVPGLRLRVQRCDTNGHPTRDGQQWGIIGP